MVCISSMKQYSLFKIPLPVHGGELSLGKRKTRRVLSNKKPIHLNLKANRNVLYKNKAFIQATTHHLSKKYDVKIYDLVINYDHIHKVIKIEDRRTYLAFIRALTGILAKKIGKGLWKFIPFTRVANWGKDYRGLLRYLQQNREEISGQRAYKPRKDWYKRRKP